MGFFRRSVKETKLCPNCHKPVTEGTVFCDSCGLRLIPPPACGRCQLPLAPETNFCESCGTPVGHIPEQSRNSPEPADKTPAVTRKKKATKGRRGKNKNPARDDPEAPAVTGPEYSRADPAPVPHVREEPPDIGPPPATRPGGAAGHPAGKAGSTGSRVIAGILVLGLIFTLILLTGYLHVPASRFLENVPWPAGQPVPSVHPDPSPPAAVTSLPETTVALPSLVPGPTRVPPERLEVGFQTERDPVTGMVTVLFMGGKGQCGVREVLVRLTRSDGQVLTRSFQPFTVGEGASLPGTKYADRLEVIVTYNNGDVYTVSDQVFAYKKRN
jgi:hypothetical protein